MSKYTPAPFELAAIATLIALQDSSATRKSAENYLAEADALLKAADKYNTRPHLTMSHLEPLKGFSFAEVLKEQSPPEKGRKKGRTMVGGITTQNGLLKAIERVFSPDIAKEIIEDGCLRSYQIKEIIADQNTLNARKTAAANQDKNKS